MAQINKRGRTFLRKKPDLKLRYRVRNFDQIVTKLGTHVDLVKIQIDFEDKLYEANRSRRTFLQRKKL